MGWLSDKADALKFKLDASGFTVGLGLSSSVFLVPVFLRELGATYTDIGLIGGLESAPYAILPAIAGYLTARFDMRKLYLLSALLAAVGSFILVITRNLLEAAAANLLLGLAMVFYWPVAESIIAEVIPEEIRWSAYAGFSASWSTAYLLGPMLGGVVADSLGLRTLFILSILLSIAAAPFIYSMGELRTKRVELEIENEWKSILLGIWPIFGSVFTFTIGLASVIILVPSYLSVEGWSMTMIGMVFTAYGATRTIAYLIMTKTKRVSAVRALISSAAMQSASLTLILAADPILIFPALMLAGSANGIYFTSVFNVISRKAPSGSKGLAIGIFETILGVGFIIGPITAGYMMDFLGAQPTFQVLALAALTTVFLALIMRKS